MSTIAEASRIGRCPKCLFIRFQTKYYLCPLGHTLCGHCIKPKRQKEAQVRCPECNQIFAEAPPRNTVAERAISRNPVEGPCQNQAKGCNFSAQKYKVHAHERNDCEITKIACPSPDCFLRIRRKDFASHLKQEHGMTPEEAVADNPSTKTSYHCTNRGQNCPFESPSKDEVHLHEVSDCPFLRIICPHSNKCWKKVMFKDLAEHVRVKHAGRIKDEEELNRQLDYGFLK